MPPKMSRRASKYSFLLASFSPANFFLSSVIKNFKAPIQLASLRDIRDVESALPIFLRRVYQSLTSSGEGFLPVLSQRMWRIKLYSAKMTKAYWNTLTSLLQTRGGCMT